MENFFSKCSLLSNQPRNSVQNQTDTWKDNQGELFLIPQRI